MKNNDITIVKRYALALLLLFITFTSQAAEKEYQYIGSPGNYNLYSKPTTSSSINGTCSNGSIGMYEDYNAEWACFTYEDGDKGYMPRKFLRATMPKLSNQEQYDAVKGKPTYMVNIGKAIVTCYPNRESGKGEGIWQLQHYEFIVDFRDVDEERIAIKINEVDEGFINKKDLILLDEDAKLKSILPDQYKEKLEKEKIKAEQAREERYEQFITTSYFKGGLLAGEKMLYIIWGLMGLLILMVIIRIISVSFEYYLLYFYGVVLLTTCLFEYWYVLSLGGERSLWFFSMYGGIDVFFAGVYTIAGMTAQIATLYYITIDYVNEANSELKVKYNIWVIAGIALLCCISSPVLLFFASEPKLIIFDALGVFLLMLPLLIKLWRIGNAANYSTKRIFWLLFALLICAIPTFVFGIVVLLLGSLIFIGIMLYQGGFLGGLIGGAAGVGQGNSTPYKCCSSCRKFSYGKCSENSGAMIHDPSSHCCGNYTG